jgi:hypothetical protein
MICDNSSRNLHHTRYLQQGVAITGAGLPSFDDILTALKSIQSIFIGCFPAHHFTNSVPSSFQDHFSFAANNRFFSNTKEISAPTVIPFPSVVDPHGTLQRSSGQDLVYAPDNVVEYYKISNHR